MKPFLIIGNQNAIAYKEIFPLIKDNKIWLGYNTRLSKFKVPNSYDIGVIEQDDNGNKYTKMGNVCWYTNLDVFKKYQNQILYKTYNAKDYPKYDNYDAINVDKTKDIPKDYFDTIGVPITFLYKYNPQQFEILDEIGRYSMINGPTKETQGKYLTNINGKRKYARIIIKRKVV